MLTIGVKYMDEWDGDRRDPGSLMLVGSLWTISQACAKEESVFKK